MSYTKVVDQSTTYTEQGNQATDYAVIDNILYLADEDLDFLVAENEDYLMTVDNETAYIEIGNQSSSYTSEILTSYLITEGGDRLTTEDADAVLIYSGGYYTKILDV